MIKLLLLAAILFATFYTAAGQANFSGKENKDIPGAGRVSINTISGIPSFIVFNDATNIPVNGFKNWMATTFNLDYRYDFKLFRQSDDELGYTHFKYQEYFSGYPVEMGIYIVHAKNGRIVSMNGLAFDKIKTSVNYTLQESQALQSALNYIGADKYMWQVSKEQNLLQVSDNNPDATYYPKGQLVLMSKDSISSEMKLAWKFNIYAYRPFSRSWYYVDALKGEVIFKNDIIRYKDVQADAYTKYSGKRTIVCDSFANSRYRLRETGRGGGIETYNDQNRTDDNNGIDFIDSDKIWNHYDSNWDEVATDAHWGAEMTYDYYKNTFGRNSIDGKGMKIKQYVHRNDKGYANAFWDGAAMNYGDGGGMPFTILDIIGHEMTHGVSGSEANFVYANESGALDESFSDIFGTMVEWYAKPTQANWMMGDSYLQIRNISDPKSMGYPATYHGQFWDFLNNEVHKNSTVNSFCFYLLAMGGSGTNDIGNIYNVTGITRDKASRIFYRALCSYLTSSAAYSDCRNACIQSAIDLYGICSQEVKSTIAAWYAVGIGTQLNMVLSFTMDAYSPNCFKNYKVDFFNTTQPIGFYSGYKWFFGDGLTSTALNPTHTYTNYGSYTVRLYGYSNCDTDSVVMVQYIKLDSNYPCAYYEPASGNQSSTLCQGVLLDDGGDGNYNNNKDVYFTIKPTNANFVELKFKSFAFEDCVTYDCDYIQVYDGPNTASPLIGKYTGFNLPNGGVIRSTGSSITVREHTDGIQVYSGFELEWYCSNPNLPPVADFTSNIQNTCKGQINFTDKSLNNPTSWLWNFGDGATSVLQNPLHVYKTTGVYNVKMAAINLHGSDTIIKPDFINISLSPITTTPDTFRCSNGTVKLNAYGYDNYFWYDNPASTYIATGPVYTTPILSSNSSYWVQGIANPDTQHVGPLDNVFGSTAYNNDSSHHFLIFDSWVDMVLLSAKVYSATTGNRSILLLNSNGDIITDTIINIPANSGGSRIKLNFNIPIGNDMRIGVAENNYLYYNTDNASFPYQIPGIISIKSTDDQFLNAKDYYYLYDWELLVKHCNSDLKKINISLDQHPNANFTFTHHNFTIIFKNTSTNARSYIWDFGDGNYDTAASPTHYYSAHTTYTVKLIAISTCGNDTFIEKINVTSIDENKLASEIKVYPNPANNSIFIDIMSSDPEKLNLKLINALSQTVIEKQIYNNGKITEVMDVSMFPKGVYFINLTDEQGTVTKRILIQ